MINTSSILTFVVAILIGLLLGPLLRQFKPLFSARYGRFSVPIAWAVAVILVVVASRIGDTHFTLATCFVLVAPIVALLPTLVYRDQRREAAGLGPVQTHFPDRLTMVGRIGVGLLAVFIGVVGVASFTLGSLNGVMAAAGAVLFVASLSFVAVTGRFPESMRRFFHSK